MGAWILVTHCGLELIEAAGLPGAGRKRSQISKGSYKLAVGEHLGVTDAGGFCACLQLDV